MLTVTEALEILKKEQITSSVQVFRRWLRAGKVPGAYQNSLKEGWKIPEDGLQSFIVTQGNEKYKASYDRGYADAMNEVAERDSKMLSRGMFETRYQLKRSDMRERIKQLFTGSKPFLLMADQLYFQEDRKNPKTSIDINIIGQVLLLNDRLIFRINEMPGNENEAVEDRVMLFMLEDIRQAVFKERKELTATYDALLEEMGWDLYDVNEIVSCNQKEGAKVIKGLSSNTRTLQEAIARYKQIIALKEKMEEMGIWKG
ncbi:hypothetical protein HCI99_16980 [Listeria booriae]|uniref:Uncharacterized protein n=1 Tax=Listeria booriae TaxID=1552123 RepID=A0A7X0XGC8_9LIST|nr:hypothetical protein [Listeria booriae]MBC1493512.1 hypothetical protein [Listeria booriae]